MASLIEKIGYLNKLMNENDVFKKLDKLLLLLTDDKKELKSKPDLVGNFVFRYSKGNKSIELAVRDKGQNFGLWLGGNVVINQVTDVDEAISKITRYLY